MARIVETMVDQTALKFNQASIIALLLLAYLLDQPWLALFVGVVMAVGTLWPRAGLFKLIYEKGLKPMGLLKPHMVVDEPAPHLFAQGLGAIVLGLAAFAFWTGASVFGWLLAGVVVVLAGVNLFFGFCLGCFVYYQLARRGVSPALPQWQTAAVKSNGTERSS